MKLEKKLLALTNGKEMIGSVTIEKINSRASCTISLSRAFCGSCLIIAGDDYFYHIDSERQKRFDFDCATECEIRLFLVNEKTVYFSGKRRVEEILEARGKIEKWEIEKNCRKENDKKTAGELCAQEKQGVARKEVDDEIDNESANCSIGYCDDAVASVNYYPSDLFFEVENKDDMDSEKTEISDTLTQKRDLFVYDLSSKTIENEKSMNEKSEEQEYRKKSVRTFCESKEDKKTNSFSPFANVEYSFSGRKADFYESVKPRVDELFKKFERESEMERLMPDTKWVKINYGNGKFYLVGIVGERPDYLCYGLPGEYSPIPPDCFDGGASFLPLDVRKPQGDGYWLIFQDARTGKVCLSK